MSDGIRDDDGNSSEANEPGDEAPRDPQRTVSERGLQAGSRPSGSGGSVAIRRRCPPAVCVDDDDDADELEPFDFDMLPWRLGGPGDDPIEVGGEIHRLVRRRWQRPPQLDGWPAWAGVRGRG